MPKHSKPVVPPVNAGPDPAAAENAFTTLLPRLRSLSADTLITLNTDLQDAAIRALAVARFLAEPEPITRFGLLSPKLFDPKHITDLAPMALAAYHASNELRSARATSSEAKIPVDLADEAISVKTRMLKLAEYAFQGDAVISLEVADIRFGTGYKDLANDLVRLAKIYIAHQGILSKDAFTYRATDVDDARKLAQRILTELGNTRSIEETKWIDLSARMDAAPKWL